MRPQLITAQPPQWRRAARTVGRWLLAVVEIAAHLAIAVIVLAARIAHVTTTVIATHTAYAELYLAQRTGRPPLGQAAGVSIAQAFADSARTAYRQTTRQGAP